jgi:hypothetical protein
MALAPEQWRPAAAAAQELSRLPAWLEPVSAQQRPVRSFPAVELFRVFGAWPRAHEQSRPGWPRGQRSPEAWIWIYEWLPAEFWPAPERVVRVGARERARLLQEQGRGLVVPPAGRAVFRERAQELEWLPLEREEVRELAQELEWPQAESEEVRELAQGLAPGVEVGESR